MMKKALLLFTAIFIVLNFIFLPQYKAYSASDQSAINKMQNLENEGLVVKQGRWLFYVSYNGICRIGFDKIINGSLNDAVLVSSNSVKSLNIEDGWIYYSGHVLSDSGYTDTVIKTRVDGKETEKLNNEKSENVKLVDGWIYYLQLPDRHLYRMKPDGSNKMQLSSDTTLHYYVLRDSIYYQNQSDKFKIYKIGTDGSNKTKISDEPTGPFSVVSDKIFMLIAKGFIQ